MESEWEAEPARSSENIICLSSVALYRSTPATTGRKGDAREGGRLADATSISAQYQGIGPEAMNVILWAVAEFT